MSVAVKADRIPNWRLRKEFQRRVELGWLTSYDVAMRLEWWHHDDKPDVSRLHRHLGMTPSYNNRQGLPKVQRTIRVDLAERIAEAMGCDPWECGL